MSHFAMNVNKKILISVFLVHSPIILWYALRDINDAEKWKYFFSFFVDFPVSLGIHYPIDFIDSVLYAIGTNIDIGNELALLLHLIVGGLWWTFLITLLVKVINKYSSSN